MEYRDELILAGLYHERNFTITEKGHLAKDINNIYDSNFLADSLEVLSLNDVIDMNSIGFRTPHTDKIPGRRMVKGLIKGVLGGKKKQKAGLGGDYGGARLRVYDVFTPFRFMAESYGDLEDLVETLEPRKRRLAFENVNLDEKQNFSLYKIADDGNSHYLVWMIHQKKRNFGGNVTYRVARDSEQCGLGVIGLKRGREGKRRKLAEYSEEALYV